MCEAPALEFGHFDKSPPPGGRFENSPAIHCRVRIAGCASPEGTAEFPGALHTAALRLKMSWATVALLSWQPAFRSFNVTVAPSSSGQDFPDDFARNIRQAITPPVMKVCELLMIHTE